MPLTRGMMPTFLRAGIAPIEARRGGRRHGT